MLYQRECESLADELQSEEYNRAMSNIKRKIERAGAITRIAKEMDCDQRYHLAEDVYNAMKIYLKRILEDSNVLSEQQTANTKQEGKDEKMDEIVVLLEQEIEKVCDRLDQIHDSHLV